MLFQTESAYLIEINDEDFKDVLKLDRCESQLFMCEPRIN